MQFFFALQLVQAHRQDSRGHLFHELLDLPAQPLLYAETVEVRAVGIVETQCVWTGLPQDAGPFLEKIYFPVRGWEAGLVLQQRQVYGNLLYSQIGTAQTQTGIDEKRQILECHTDIFQYLSRILSYPPGPELLEPMYRP